MTKQTNIFNKCKNLISYHHYITILEVYTINTQVSTYWHQMTFKKQLIFMKQNKIMMMIFKKKVKIKLKKYAQIRVFNNVIINN